MTRRRGGRGEEGAVAIIVALCLTGLLVIAAMVIDFGLARIDRQVDKSAADSATLAGLHALGGNGSGSAHPYHGVCTALRYLKENGDRFSTINENDASLWFRGDADDPNPVSAGASGCDTTMWSKTCIPGDTSSWARFSWTGETSDGLDLTVTVQSGYDLSSSHWLEDGLPASQSDQTDDAQGCDQLSVIVSQARDPGLGSLATSSDLKTAIRSVGRAELQPGGYAPAMLLLKQTGCSVLSTGTAAGGSHITVLGAGSHGFAQPGSIHSDSNGSGCGSNEDLFVGNDTKGIVAYAAPVLDAFGNATSVADAGKPGQITAFLATTDPTSGKLRDSSTWVCGSAGLSPSGTCPGPRDVSGLDRVLRTPVDDRYFTAIQGISSAAVNAFAAAPSIPKVLASCTPTQADVTALGSIDATSAVFVSCVANNGFRPAANLSIPAGTVVFAGRVNPQAKLSLPNATHVYVAGNAQGGITLGGGGAGFSMHTAGPGGVNNAPAGLCSNAATNTKNKAVLVVRNNTIDESNGSSLQLCYTTVLMKGGQGDGCLNSVNHSGAPNPGTPCGGGTGTGQLKQTGGDVDWTAPNRYDVMLLADGSPDPTKKDEWTDPDGPEDLAFWSESGANGSGTKYQMTGGGTVHLVGVLMTPNAQPFSLTGQFNQTLINAQYIASSINLSSNNTNITMTVDPNSAVTLPKLAVVGLVR